MFNAAAHAACTAATRRDRLGYIPDKTHDQRPHVLSLGLTTTSAAASKVEWNGTSFNQGGFGSCGGHGTAKAQRQAYLSAGFPWPFAGDNQDFSPCWFYKLARRISMPATSASGPPLTDSGIDPTSLLSVTPLGLVPIGTDGQCPAPDGTYTDCYAATVNVDVQLDAEIEGRSNIDISAYNVDASSGDADAIAAQVTPILQTPGLSNAFGIFVDSAFENWDPSQGPLASACNLNDPSGGGHWIDQDEITMTYVNGTRCWGFLNSWGSWGLNGRIYVTDTRLVTMTSQIIAFKANSAATPWKAAA
jgi:hypothetical protein